MAELSTVSDRIAGLPLRGLRVEVIRGPDVGKIAIAKSDTISVGTAESNDLVLGDQTVSRYHCELQRKADRIWVSDHGSTNGTEAGPVAISHGSITSGTVLSLGHTAIKVDDGETVTLELHQHDRLGELLGRTTEMRSLMAMVERVAQREASVLVLGETGTGKELIAHAMHATSPRAKGPFETVDCAAMLPTLIASELFGHERGAFTGADSQHIGAFERAHGGTLFLDEVGELPPQLQTSLLGALERRSFRRLGGQKTIAVDVRVVCATNRDLRGEVNAGTFRQDLYYRVAVVLLRVPPLRERAGDIPLLVEHFLREAGLEGQAEDLLSEKMLATLRAHRWPGNVRELRNFIEATVAMGTPPPLEEDTADEQEDAAAPAAAPPAPAAKAGLTSDEYSEARAKVLKDFELAYVKELMERFHWNASLAAREAKMNRSYLVSLVRRHGLR